ncbi:hypothetical protein DRQ11_08510 [candidate division KSB1 bacterium]|nr:MAG: hypothetical protein DRQ11_08510 [candidate division KSB1 bacterium]
MRKIRTLLQISFFLAFLIISPLTYSSETLQVGEKCTYKIWLGGKEAGYCTYYVKTKDEQGYHIRSKVQVEAMIKLTLYEKLLLSEELIPLKYTLDAFVGNQHQRIEARCEGKTAKLHYRLPGEEKDAEVKLGENLVILDNNVIDHWVFIVKRYDYHKSGEQSFFALVPQVAKGLTLDLKMIDSVEVELEEEKFAAIHLSGQLAGIGIDLWVDPQTRSLLKVAIPSQQFEGIKAKAVIDFSEEELEKRLGEIKGKEEKFIEERYHSEEIIFNNGDIKLAGTLTIPDTPVNKKYPGVVFIHGSGPVDRNENAGFMRMFFFRQLADTLSKAGFVTLRYDKRGVGESTGDLKQADLEDLISDAAKAVDFLRKRPEVDPKKIGLIGHSEGGTIGPILCSRDPEIAALVVMAGMARPIDQVTIDQIRYLSHLRGLKEDEIEVEVKKQEDFFEKIRNREEISQIPGFSPDWWRQHMENKPLENIKKVKCPILILNGGKDYQISVEKDAQKLAQTLQEVNHPDFTLKIFPNLDHLFAWIEGPSKPEYYLDSSRKIGKDVLATLSSWLIQRLKD